MQDSSFILHRPCFSRGSTSRTRLLMGSVGLTVLAFLTLASPKGWAESKANPQSEKLNKAQLVPITLERKLSFAHLGQPGGASLNGIRNTLNLNAGVRLDETLVQATLNLNVLYPQGMRHDQSFIRVYVNNQLSSLSQLNSNKAGVAHMVPIELDPLLFSDFSNIRIEYSGTYDSLCVDPNNPTLRLDIRSDSQLILKYQPLNLVNDLGLLPAPFFDPRDGRPVQMAIVLPQQITSNVLKAAGIVSSWLGAQAFYRQAQFEVLSRPSPDTHTMVLSIGAQTPRGVPLRGPTLSMEADPNKPWIKHLYIMGRNEAELLDAVHGLTIEGQVLSGQQALVKKVNLGPPRAPYDAPRYVPTQRPVRFAELLDYPSQLEANRENPKVRLNLRLPPDLFSWAGRNIPMNLKYRYTAPSDWNNSLMNVEINSALVQSFRLPPRGDENQSRLGLDLLGQTELSREEALQIPAFRVGGNNELAFDFVMMSEGKHLCNSSEIKSRGAIDPESTLDFSDLPHYTRMPNLAAFANGGYPFSVYADLSDTAIVLPSQPKPGELNAFLNIMGLFGQWTGLPASRVAVMLGKDANNLGGKHWLALGTQERLSWLNQYNMNLPMVLSQTERSMGNPTMVRWFQNLWGDSNTMPPTPATQALIQTSGSLGAILGFESHGQQGKAGLVITGTDESSFERAVAALGNFTDVGKLKGSVSLIRGTDIQSYQMGKTYVSGYLPWWLRLRIALTEYPALVAVGGALAGIGLALIAFGWLSRRAARRSKLAQGN